MRSAFLMVFLAFTAGCGKASADDLLAKDLVYENEDHGWKRTVQIDPWLSVRPDLARTIMTDQLKKFAAETDDCSDDNGKPGCSSDHVFNLSFNGSRVVSVLEERTIDLGGAHPVESFQGHLFDVATGQRIGFHDLFHSWQQAKPELQARFCKSLSLLRSDVEECPDIEKQGLSAAKGRILVTTNDYAIGSYATGREVVAIWIDGEIGQYGGFASLIKPEYLTDLSNER